MLFHHISCFDDLMKLILQAVKKSNSYLCLYMIFQSEGSGPFLLVHKKDLAKDNWLLRARQLGDQTGSLGKVVIAGKEHYLALAWFNLNQKKITTFAHRRNSLSNTSKMLAGDFLLSLMSFCGWWNFLATHFLSKSCLLFALNCKC